MSVEILLSVNQDLSLNLTINSKAYNYLSEKLLLKLFRKIGSSVVSVSRPFNVKGLPKKREREKEREKNIKYGSRLLDQSLDYYWYL